MDNLASHIDWYLRRVIGVDLKLIDRAQPGVEVTKGNKIHLPVSEQTLSDFLGEEFVKKASQELLFSIVIGFAYHECGHILSGENHRLQPLALNNLICEANDFTFVPNRWPGSIPYTLTAVNVTYHQMEDIDNLPLETNRDKLSVLFLMVLMFLRKLRIKYKQKEVRKLPEDHPLHDYFERLKPILVEARRCKVEERPALLKSLFSIFQDFWVEPNEVIQLVLEEAERASRLRVPLSGEEAARLESQIQKAGIQKDLVFIGEEIRKEGKSEKSSLSIKRNHSVEEIVEREKKPKVDEKLAGEVRRILRPLFFSRTIARRTASVVGSSFHPGRFYEIKTRPGNARIHRDVLRIKRQIDESLVILCFDRSGSMGCDGKSQVCQEVAATMYTALVAIPRCEIKLLGFNEDVARIKEGKSLSGVLSSIPVALSPEGGTNLPLALHECLKMAKEVKAQTKLIVMLTDGDITGTYAIRDLLEQAHRLSIEVICIGIQGSDLKDLVSAFGYRNVVYVKDARRLGKELKRVIVKRV